MCIVLRLPRAGVTPEGVQKLTWKKRVDLVNWEEQCPRDAAERHWAPRFWSDTAGQEVETRDAAWHTADHLSTCTRLAGWCPPSWALREPGDAAGKDAHCSRTCLLQ